MCGPSIRGTIVLALPAARPPDSLSSHALITSSPGPAAPSPACPAAALVTSLHIPGHRRGLGLPRSQAARVSRSPPRLVSHARVFPPALSDSQSEENLRGSRPCVRILCTSLPTHLAGTVDKLSLPRRGPTLFICAVGPPLICYAASLFESQIQRIFFGKLKKKNIVTRNDQLP